MRIIKNSREKIATTLINTRTKFGKFFSNRTALDYVTTGIMVIALLALFALLYYYVRPIRTVDIKVPVATDQSSYAPGESIGGIFFGETYYEGHVKILREVFCTNYKGFIPPENGQSDGNLFSTYSVPRKLEGITVPIGKLPADIPVGVNCVLRFTNIYEIQTPFGIRKITTSYYTQNFAIISVERRNILDCEARGEKDCVEKYSGSSTISDNTPTTQTAPTSFSNGYESTNSNNVSQPSQNTTNNTTNNSTTNNTTNNNTTNEPAPDQCTAQILFIKIACN